MAASIPTGAAAGKPPGDRDILARPGGRLNGLRAHGIAGADQEGGGGAGPHLPARLLARQGRSRRVPERGREGLRGQRLAPAQRPPGGSPGPGPPRSSRTPFSVSPPTPLVKYGTEAMKRAYLPRIVSGDIVMAFGVTEPNAGTDTSRIQTRAVKQ